MGIPAKSASRNDLQRPAAFGQRPVFKDFSLTKRSTADRKSQALPPVFFTHGRDCILPEQYIHASIGNDSGEFECGTAWALS
jgi:hypothetical protein